MAAPLPRQDRYGSGRAKCGSQLHYDLGPNELAAAAGAAMCASRRRRRRRGPSTRLCGARSPGDRVPRDLGKRTRRARQKKPRLMNRPARLYTMCSDVAQCGQPASSVPGAIYININQPPVRSRRSQPDGHRRQPFSNSGSGGAGGGSSRRWPKLNQCCDARAACLRSLALSLALGWLALLVRILRRPGQDGRGPLLRECAIDLRMIRRGWLPVAPLVGGHSGRIKARPESAQRTGPHRRRAAGEQSTHTGRHFLFAANAASRDLGATRSQS